MSATTGRKQIAHLVKALGFADKQVRKLSITYELNRPVVIEAECFASDDQLEVLLKHVEVDWKYYSEDSA